MKKFVVFSLLLLICCFLCLPGLYANEEIDPTWYGPGGLEDPYALISRSTDDTDPTAAYTPSPADWRDRNIYQLFTDRFATDGVDRLTTYDGTTSKAAWKCDTVNYPYNRNFHHGGSWKGLQQQIPYLQGMGVTAVWLSGVQQNDQGPDTNYTPYHQYHAENFFRCDPAMGTFQDLTDVIDALHAAGIAVILDVAPNHMCDKTGIYQWGNPSDKESDKGYWAGGPTSGYEFNWWNQSNKHWPPFDNLDYFHNNGTITNWDANPDKYMGQFKGTDDLNSEHPDVTKTLVKAFKNLIDATDCDGFRVDAIKHMPYEWCRNWADAMLQHAKWRGKNNFLMFGELFVYDNGALGSWCKDGYGFNSALLFPLMQAMDNVFGKGTSGYQLGEEINQIAGNYGQGAERAIAFLDNHDVNRFAQKFAANNATYAKKIMAPAMTFLYLAPPVPLLFYGTEHMFDQGGHSNGQDWSSTNDDADWQREAMFNKGFQPGNATGDKFTDAAKESGLYYHIAWLNGLRNQSRALRRGGFAQRKYASGQGIYAFTKWYDQEVALVIVNTADGSQNLGTINAGKGNAEFFENGTGDSVGWSDDNGNLNLSSINLEGKGSKVYICNFVNNSADLGVGSIESPWVSGTYAYPPENAEAGFPIYVNTEAGPADLIESVKIVYAFNAASPDDWQEDNMTINTNWDSPKGGAWFNYEFSNPPEGTLEYVICMTSTNGVEVWDNNSHQNYSLSIGPATAPQDIRFTSVNSHPTEPTPDGTVTITAAITYESTLDVSALACGIGYAINPAAGAVWPVLAMTKLNSVTNDAQVVTYFNYVIDDLTAGTTIKYYLEASNGTAKIYANNSGNNYSIQVQTLNLPEGLAITDPAELEATTGETSYLITGTAGEDLLSPISWVSDSDSGTITLTPYWSFLADLLPGTNTFTFSAPIGAWATNTLAEDKAANYTDWTDGSNKGTGFGAWVLNAVASKSGHFLEGDLFGMWSSQNNLAEAIRPFSSPLAAGDVFSARMNNKGVVTPSDPPGDWTSGGIGFALQNAGGDTLWQIWFNGGDTYYGVTGAEESGIHWTDAGLDIRFAMTSTNTYEVTVTPVGGTAYTFFGSLSDPVARLRTWSYSNQYPDDGSTSDRDYFFGNLKITRTALQDSGTTSSQQVILIYADEKDGPRITTAEITATGDGFRFTPEAGYKLGTVQYATELVEVDGKTDWNFQYFATVTNYSDGSVGILAPSTVSNAIFRVYFEEE